MTPEFPPQEGVANFERFFKEIGYSRETLDRYNDILYGVSTEPRQTFLVFGLTSLDLSVPEIDANYKAAFPENPWIMHQVWLRRNIARFTSVGLVQKKSMDDRWMKYSLSPLGVTMGRLVAAKLIQQATVYGSFVDILGEHEPERDSDEYDIDTSHMRRTALLFGLAHGISSQIELARQMGYTPNTVRFDLEALQKAKFVDYASVAEGQEGYAPYERAVDPPTLETLIGQTDNAIRKQVLTFFLTNPLSPAKPIQQAIKRRTTSDLYPLLASLVEEGILGRPGYIGAQTMSDAFLTSRGEQFLSDYPTAMLSACAGDPRSLSLLRDNLDAVETDRTIGKKAIDAYIDASAWFNNKPRAETRQEVITHLQTAGPMRSKDLRNHFGPRIQAILPELVSEGLLVRHQQGNAVWYSLPGQILKEEEKTTIVYSYPIKKLPPPGSRSSEEHRRDLEKKEFWTQLFEDLSSLDRAVAPNVFFMKYAPQRDGWWETKNGRFGRYTNLTIALRTLGIHHPFDFIRDYAPKDTELQPPIDECQRLIKEKLIRKKRGK